MTNESSTRHIIHLEVPNPYGAGVINHRETVVWPEDRNTCCALTARGNRCGTTSKYYREVLVDTGKTQEVKVVAWCGTHDPIRNAERARARVNG